jgi:hypothetical protein
VVRVNKTKEEMTLQSFLSHNVSKEWDIIKDLLSRTKRNLNDRADPVVAIADEAENLFRREYNFGFQRREDS